MTLSWNAYEGLEKAVSQETKLNSAIAPYIKKEALLKLLELPRSEGFYIITRWKLADFLLGASDIEVYEILEDHNIPLYVNNRLHLKLYQYGRMSALCGSANITANGLGLSSTSNIELSAFIEITHHDQASIQALCDSSKRVTDEIFEDFKNKIEAHPPLQIPTDEPLVSDNPDEMYLVSSLPALDSPNDLIEAYSNPSMLSDLEYTKFIHDYNLFRLSPGLSQNILGYRIQTEFIKVDFVKLVISEIQKSKTLRFGAVNDLIHSHCRDVPLPYRWELKPATHRLYDWLACLVDNISWERPGHSQVLMWRKP